LGNFTLYSIWKILFYILPKGLARLALNLISMSDQFNAVIDGQIISIPLRPYYLKELAAMYGISTKTFNKWLKPFSKIIGQRRGYYFTIPQVRKIFKVLEFPSVMYDRVG